MKKRGLLIRSICIVLTVSMLAVAAGCHKETKEVNDTEVSSSDLISSEESSVDETTSVTETTTTAPETAPKETETTLNKKTEKKTSETTSKETVKKVETSKEIQTTVPVTTKKATEPAKINFTDVKQVVYATGYTKVYSQTSTSSSSIGELGYGNAVERTGTGSGWSRVIFNGKTGYVPSGKVTATKPKTETTRTVVKQETKKATEQTTEAAEEKLEPKLCKNMLKLVNKERKKRGLEPYTWAPELEKGTLIRAKEQGTLYSHTRPNGEDAATAFRYCGGITDEIIADAGYDYSLYSEFIEQMVFDAWLASPGHRHAIVSKNDYPDEVAPYDYDVEYEDGSVIHYNKGDIVPGSHWDIKICCASYGQYWVMVVVIYNDTPHDISKK